MVCEGRLSSDKRAAASSRHAARGERAAWRVRVRAAASVSSCECEADRVDRGCRRWSACCADRRGWCEGVLLVQMTSLAKKFLVVRVLRVV